jgi:hypothetical protein
MFTKAHDAKRFIYAGNARFTLTSTKTDTSFTFKMNAPKNDDGIRFVKVLNGPDNSWDGDWMFLGHVKMWGGFPTTDLIAGKKGHPDAPSFKALSWTLSQLNQDNIPEALEIRHEGKCCKCGRTLTVPESIDTGVGPECRKKMGLK